MDKSEKIQMMEEKAELLQALKLTIDMLIEARETIVNMNKAIEIALAKDNAHRKALADASPKYFSHFE